MMRRPQERFNLLTQGAGVALVPEPANRLALASTPGASMPGTSLRDYTRIGASHLGGAALLPPGGAGTTATLHAIHPAREDAPKAQTPPTIQRSHGCTLW